MYGNSITIFRYKSFFFRFRKRGLPDCATWDRTTTPTVERYPCAARPQRTELCKFAYAQLCIRSHWPGRMRRWYCSQITRRADAGHGDACAVVADDDTPDSIRLCSKWYGPIGNTLIYNAFGAIRLHYSRDFVRTIRHAATLVFIRLTLWRRVISQSDYLPKSLFLVHFIVFPRKRLKRIVRNWHLLTILAYETLIKGLYYLSRLLTTIVPLTHDNTI